MTEDKRDFAFLMNEVRNGSETALRELVAHYGEHILRVVRRRLHKSLRPKFDSQDFVQAVWASFFAFERNRYIFDRPEELIAFLAEMARNKVVEAVRQRMLTQKYNVGRERSLAGHSVVRTALAQEPTAEEVAIASEEWQLLLERQPAHYRVMLEMLCSGHARNEVAQELGVDRKTINRVLDKISPP